MSAFEIRPACGQDLNFIFDTWLNSFRYDSPLGKSCKNSVFFNEYKQVIDRILSEAEVLMAHSNGNENHILAYLVFHPPFVVHYAFCKEAFRRLGITKTLFVKAFGDEAAKVEFTHRTGYIAEFIRDKPNFTHNPFHLFVKGAI